MLWWILPPQVPHMMPSSFIYIYLTYLIIAREQLHQLTKAVRGYWKSSITLCEFAQCSLLWQSKYPKILTLRRFLLWCNVDRFKLCTPSILLHELSWIHAFNVITAVSAMWLSVGVYELFRLLCKYQLAKNRATQYLHVRRECYTLRFSSWPLSPSKTLLALYHSWNLHLKMILSIAHIGLLLLSCGSFVTNALPTLRSSSVSTDQVSTSSLSLKQNRLLSLL